MPFFQALADLGIPDILDIVVVAVVLYGLIRGIRSSRSGVVLAGFIMVSSLYLVARFLDLSLVTFIFQVFFTVILVALIVIFQEDLRRLFERVALGGLRRNRGKDLSTPAHALVDDLVRSLGDLARDKVGAIVVLQGRESVQRHIHGGITLDAKPSEALFKSLFDPHSIGHDGAVILSGERVLQFSCHLPLSADAAQLRGRGTRHAAALGLAERSDALCLVVSEERGTICVARNGNLTTVKDAVELRQVVEEFLLSQRPQRKRKGWVKRIHHNATEKTAALVVAVLLWFFFVHESEVVYRTFEPRIVHAGVPAGFKVSEVKPKSVKVILSAPRRSFYFVDNKDVLLTTKFFDDPRVGPHDVSLTAPDVSFPQGLTFVNIIPRDIKIFISPEQPEPEKGPPK